MNTRKLTAYANQLYTDSQVISLLLRSIEGSSDKLSVRITGCFDALQNIASELGIDPDMLYCSTNTKEKEIALLRDTGKDVM